MADPYYSDEFVTLYHGDCREIDAWLEADVLVTDPPYGIAYSSGWATEMVWPGGTYSGAADGSIAGDASVDARDMALAAWGDGPGLVFGSMRAPAPKAWKQVLCWDKGESAGMGDLSIPWRPNWDPIFIVGGPWLSTTRVSGVLSFPNISRVSMGRQHPHSKPARLMADLIAKCPPGTVADPFAGSGSTIVAAKRLGRKAIGVELDERYCEIAAKRLAQGVLDFGAA